MIGSSMGQVDSQHLVPVQTSSVRMQRSLVSERASVPNRTLDLLLELEEVTEECLPATTLRKHNFDQTKRPRESSESSRERNREQK